MSHMRVSNSVEKAFQLAFLKLKRRRKGVGVGVTAALIRMAIGRCWVCGIGSSTALLLSDEFQLIQYDVSAKYRYLHISVYLIPWFMRLIYTVLFDNAINTISVNRFHRLYPYRSLRNLFSKEYRLNGCILSFCDLII